jgi:CRISPR-associated protein Cmr6
MAAIKQARRDALRDVKLDGSTHVGLWLDRYLDFQNDQTQRAEREDGDAGRIGQHFLSVQARPIPLGYPEAYDRWRAGLSPNDGSIVATPITATGRIALGLGNKGVLENGLHLDHTWGVPVIPGSALKGVAAAAAHLLTNDREWKKGGTAHARRGDHHAALFGQGGAARGSESGSEDCIGRVRFLDAWWIPRDDRDRPEPHLPIHLDIMTVHHAAYYQDDSGRTLPLDTDSPNPVPFATISGRFLLVLQLTDPSDDAGWLDLALDLLEEGLTELGIGAKTNAGYGRMTLSLPAKKARDLRAEFSEASRPAEDRWPRDHADVLAKSPIDQGYWLLQHGRTVPEGYGFDETRWRSLLTTHFTPAITLLKQTPDAASGAVDLDQEITDLKRKRHEVQQRPVDKRDDKAVRRRRTELDGLENQLKLKESQRSNLAAHAEREAAARRVVEAQRQAFLAWYLGS